MESKKSELEWSFSFYEQEYFDNSYYEDEEKAEKEKEENKKEKEEKQEVGRKATETNYATKYLKSYKPRIVQSSKQFCSQNLYNPFILTKMNYFQRKQTRVHHQLCGKKVVASTRAILRSLENASGSCKDVIFWKNTLKWNQRKGCPSMNILSGVCSKLNSDMADLNLERKAHEPWFTVGVSQPVKYINFGKHRAKRE